jgi:putative flippase GtrA
MRNIKHLASLPKRHITTMLKVDFIRFALVGCVGFAVTSSMLILTNSKMGIPIFLATLVSSEVGLLATFVFHNSWTYKHLNHQDQKISKKLMRFHTSPWSGVAIISVIVTFCVSAMSMNVFIANVIASGVAMFWNFFWTRYYIFKGKTPAPLLGIEDTVDTISAA